MNSSVAQGTLGRSKHWRFVSALGVLVALAVAPRSGFAQAAEEKPEAADPAAPAEEKPADAAEEKEETDEAEEPEPAAPAVEEKKAAEATATTVPPEEKATATIATDATGESEIAGPEDDFTEQKKRFPEGRSGPDDPALERWSRDRRRLRAIHVRAAHRQRDGARQRLSRALRDRSDHRVQVRPELVPRSPRRRCALGPRAVQHLSDQRGRRVRADRYAQDLGLQDRPLPNVAPCITRGLDSICSRSRIRAPASVTPVIRPRAPRPSAPIPTKSRTSTIERRRATRRSMFIRRHFSASRQLRSTARATAFATRWARVALRSFTWTSCAFPRPASIAFGRRRSRRPRPTRWATCSRVRAASSHRSTATAAGPRSRFAPVEVGVNAAQGHETQYGDNGAELSGSSNKITSLGGYAEFDVGRLTLQTVP